MFSTILTQDIVGLSYHGLNFNHFFADLQDCAEGHGMFT